MIRIVFRKKKGAIGHCTVPEEFSGTVASHIVSCGCIVLRLEWAA